MIRRDDGSDWLLISQVRHARLAAEIAAVWGNDSVSKLPNQRPLLRAIAMHDEGWDQWERHVEVHPETGEPRNFTEMRMQASTKIWEDSIQCCLGIDDDLSELGNGSCGTESPLSALWVSKHFCWLAEKALTNREHEYEDRDALQVFVDSQSDRQSEWHSRLTQHSEFDGHDRLDQQIESGFRWIQFFDRLSLWLCCEPRETPMNIDGDVTGRWQFTPLEENEIQIEPYPLSVPAFNITVSAKRIPAKIYFSDEQLQQAIRKAESFRLDWTLRG